MRKPNELFLYLGVILLIATGQTLGISALPAVPDDREPGMGYREEQDRAQEPLPWEGDPHFVAAVTENGARVLMARYSAVFPGPTPGELYNVGLSAQRLAGTVVRAGEVFSQNSLLGPYTGEKGYQEGPIFKGNQVVNSTGGGVCKVASLLYNVAVLCNFTVLERHNHSMTVPYVPPGQDATVFYGSKDFCFRNDSSGPVVIWAETVDNTLHIAAYGQEKPPEVTWRHEVVKQVDYWTVYRTNPDLAPGTEEVIIPGQKGCQVRSTALVKGKDGRVEEKDLGESWYNVQPQVIERGPEPNPGTG